MRADGRKPSGGLVATAALAALVIAFGLLRVASGLGDLYIDEIWSCFFARQMTGLLDAFSLNHDNNHLLNTLYLYLVGDAQFFLFGSPSFLVHRLLSILTGTVSLFIVWRIAAKKGLPEAFSAVVLAGLSFPLVVYSSEARGYAPAIMFALASYHFAAGRLSGRGAASVVLFWLTASLAFLSHSSYVYVYAGLLIWTAVEELKSGEARGAAKRLAVLHGVPMVFLAAWYFLFLMSMVYGGGETGAAWGEALVTASMALGLPSGGPFGYISLVVVLVLSAGGLLALRRSGGYEPLFFLAAVFVVPALIVVVLKPEFLYFRYFLVSFPFFYLLAAFGLSALYRRAAWGKAVFFVALVLFGAANLWHSVRLVEQGRGAYSEALEYMVGATEGPVVLVAGDHDFRNGMVVGFYSAYFRGKRVVYLDAGARQGASPDWLLRHSVDASYRPPAYLFDSGSRYSLERSYGFAGVSGWSWFVYRKEVEGG